MQSSYAAPRSVLVVPFAVTATGSSRIAADGQLVVDGALGRVDFLRHKIVARYPKQCVVVGHEQEPERYYIVPLDDKVEDD